jgi:hypothetical protein
MIGDSIGGDTIVINTESGAYYSLTEVAGRLWDEAETGSVSCAPGEMPVLLALAAEGILEKVEHTEPQGAAKPGDAFVKYTEMADILLADPIHEVDEDGWPKIR